MSFLDELDTKTASLIIGGIAIVVVLTLGIACLHTGGKSMVSNALFEPEPAAQNWGVHRQPEGLVDRMAFSDGGNQRNKREENWRMQVESGVNQLGRNDQLEAHVPLNQHRVPVYTSEAEDGHLGVFGDQLISVDDQNFPYHQDTGAPNYGFVGGGRSAKPNAQEVTIYDFEGSGK